MILLSHPTGNTFVRALLKSFEESRCDYSFFTTVAFEARSRWLALMPQSISEELRRRSYEINQSRIQTDWVREFGRLFFSRLPGKPFTKHESGFFSVDAVYRHLDRVAAKAVRKDSGKKVQLVYAYEDGACETFRQARSFNAKCCYELPIAYWELSRCLLAEEKERWPEWEPTLGATEDSEIKRERKTEELALANIVICPSRFVFDSLPSGIRQKKRCVIAEFGSPYSFPQVIQNDGIDNRPLRVLFAGSMTQRKGLADLFAAMRLLKGRNIQLVVMGSPILPMEFYRAQFAEFSYESPRPHREVLQLMQSCDLLVLPSIVEGRALVQQEALSCGLPLIVTRNAGGEDLIESGKTGFLVPIRSPEQIAEKIGWFDDHRSLLPDMRASAQEKARQYTWEAYGQKILSTILAE
ncbi:MAG: glycosyl transferase group 1 [Verrucomicrobiales bacterium]|nr:glycosyl transferase group 1 [Verrucomicrobiales bacterium]